MFLREKHWTMLKHEKLLSQSDFHVGHWRERSMYEYFGEQSCTPTKVTDSCCDGSFIHGQMNIRINETFQVTSDWQVQFFRFHQKYYTSVWQDVVKKYISELFLITRKNIIFLCEPCNLFFVESIDCLCSILNNIVYIWSVALLDKDSNKWMKKAIWIENRVSGYLQWSMAAF